MHVTLTCCHSHHVLWRGRARDQFDAVMRMRASVGACLNADVEMQSAINPPEWQADYHAACVIPGRGTVQMYVRIIDER